MNKIVNLIVLCSLLGLVSCKKELKSELGKKQIRITERVLFKQPDFELEKGANREWKTKLKIVEKDSSIFYIYKRSHEEKYSSFFRYDKYTSELYMAPKQTLLKNKRQKYLNERLSDKPFYFFWNIEEIPHLTEPILFNEDYSVLMVVNEFSNNWVFLNKEDVGLTNEITKEIKKMYLN